MTIAFERSAKRNGGNERENFAAERKDRRVLHAESAQVAGWQQRSEVERLRRAFNKSGISKNLSAKAGNRQSGCTEISLALLNDRRTSTSRQSSIVSVVRQTGLSLGRLPLPGKFSEEGRMKSDIEGHIHFSVQASSGKYVSASSKRHALRSRDLPSRQKNLLFQEHHGVENPFGVWHGVCIYIPESCTKCTLRAGMGAGLPFCRSTLPALAWQQEFDPGFDAGILSL